MQYQLSISGFHFELIKAHLYPGDNLEAVALALCGRLDNENTHKLVVNEVLLIPFDECDRRADFVCWKTERLTALLERAMKHNFAILKVHSHPGGYEQFSALDDDSDGRLFSSIFGWVDSDLPHGSSIMLPDGKVFGRAFHPDMTCQPFDKVSVAGDVMKIWNYSTKEAATEIEVGKRTQQAFGEGTFNLLRKLKIGIVGSSGTGSPVIEMLTRLGVGELILIDPDKVELKNLNRILNTKRSDAKRNRFKVKVLAQAIKALDIGTRTKVFACNIYNDLKCLKELAECDAIFGCVDSVDGRDLLNRLAAYYLIPYFDLGIKLEADGFGGVTKIVGSVNYIQPGKSSLMSRGLYDSEDLKAAGLYRMYPSQFPDLVKNSYIKNLNVGRPAVISVNMMVASYAVNEFLNRIHPFKSEACEEYAQSTIDLTEGCFIHRSERKLKEDSFLKSRVGLGDRRVFLDMTELQLGNH